MKNKITERFEDQLDIRRFVSAQTNLDLLLQLLLSNSQALLFKHHRARTVSSSSEKEKSKRANVAFLSNKDSDGNGGSGQDKKKLRKVLDKQLLGYVPTTNLDQQLLAGVIDARVHPLDRTQDDSTFVGQTDSAINL